MPKYRKAFSKTSLIDIIAALYRQELYKNGLVLYRKSRPMSRQNLSHDGELSRVFLPRPHTPPLGVVICFSNSRERRSNGQFPSMIDVYIDIDVNIASS